MASVRYSFHGTLFNCSRNHLWGVVRLKKRTPEDGNSPSLGSKLTPFGQGSGTVELEILSIIEVAFLIKVVVDRGMSREKILKRFYAPGFCHCVFSSPERLM